MKERDRDKVILQLVSTTEVPLFTVTARNVLDQGQNGYRDWSAAPLTPGAI